jgi:hypothetical protein
MTDQQIAAAWERFQAARDKGVTSFGTLTTLADSMLRNNNELAAFADSLRAAYAAGVEAAATKLEAEAKKYERLIGDDRLFSVNCEVIYRPALQRLREYIDLIRSAPGGAPA